MQSEKLFPAQEENENIFKVIRRHWFTYLIFWFLATFMLIPLIIGLYYLWTNYESLNQSTFRVAVMLMSSYSLFIVGLLIYGFIDYYLDVYIITDRRIVDIKQNGFFKRTISTLNLRQVQDVNAKVNGMFPTLFHYGNVLIQTAGERDNFEFLSIPHPYDISKLILDLHEQYLSSNGKTDPPKDHPESDKLLGGINDVLKEQQKSQ